MTPLVFCFSLLAHATALNHFEAMQKDQSQSERQKAEYQLAAALEAQGYLIPAMYYYKNVFLTGSEHPNLHDSIVALINIARQLKDDFVVPSIIASRYDQYFEQLSKLDGERAMHVNYMIGALDYRQGKFDFALKSLGAVEGLLKAKARYLMGVILVRQGDNKGALAHFSAAVELVNANDADEARIAVRNLALLGIARAQYALGQYGAASESYQKVPRFSKEWPEALLENGWSYFQQEDYGRALGQVESVLTPFFNKRFRAEAFVLAATVYYSNCQFDRTRGMLEAFMQRYEPALEKVRKYVATERKNTEIYQDLVATNAALPEELLRQIRRNGRFLNYHRVISEINREQVNLAAADNWRGSAMRTELETILREQKSEFEDYTGRWVAAQWKNQAEVLQQFVNQARIIKFETATSEKEIIERGGSVTGLTRRRLPRPEIPSDQFNHWNFRGEYWADEVGYYVHSVRKECAEAGVATQ